MWSPGEGGSGVMPDGALAPACAGTGVPGSASPKYFTEVQRPGIPRRRKMKKRGPHGRIRPVGSRRGWLPS